jgi:hypothetical protein
VKELQLPLANLKGQTTDVAPSLTAKEWNGKVLWVEYATNEGIVSKFYKEIHCIFHQQSLFGKALKTIHVMEVLLSGVNFIRSDALIITSFNFFCQKFTLNVGTCFTIQNSDG